MKKRRQARANGLLAPNPAAKERALTTELPNFSVNSPDSASLRGLIRAQLEAELEARHWTAADLFTWTACRIDRDPPERLLQTYARLLRDRRRLMSRVTVNPVTGCWMWRGRLNGTAPTFDLYEGHSYAARVAWTMLRGPLPDNVMLGVTCESTSLCINPDHHIPLTDLCHRGHPKSEFRAGRCRPCRRLAEQKYRARKRRENYGLAARRS
jgi:hypothetical protein